MESLGLALEQKTEEIIRLSEELEFTKSKNNTSFDHEDSHKSIKSLDSDSSQKTSHLKVTDTSMDTDPHRSTLFNRSRPASATATSGVHQRKSYLFAMRTPMQSVPDPYLSFESLENHMTASSQYTQLTGTHSIQQSLLPNQKELMDHMHPTANFSFDANSSDKTSNNSRQSVLSVGGGHGMHVFQSSRDWEKLAAINEEKSDYKHLYTDDKHGLDVFVFTQNIDNECKSPDGMSNNTASTMMIQLILCHLI